MTDNPDYNLAVRIAAARAIADVSIDPTDHRYYHALQGVASAEESRLTRATYDRYHGVPDPESFPPASEATEPGTSEWLWDGRKTRPESL